MRNIASFAKYTIYFPSGQTETESVWHRPKTNDFMFWKDGVWNVFNESVIYNHTETEIHLSEDPKKEISKVFKR